MSRNPTSTSLSPRGLAIGIPILALLGLLFAMNSGSETKQAAVPASAPTETASSGTATTTTTDTESAASMAAKAATENETAATTTQTTTTMTQVASAGQPRSGSFTDAQKREIGEIIKQYLTKDNPEVMIEVQAALQAKQQEIEQSRMKVAISANKTELFNRPQSAIGGNPKGDVTVVEFFDYNCGFCKRAFGDVAKVVNDDSNVRVVFKELPILSKGSEEAARVALAARAQGKYWEMHRALLETRGRANEATALKAAAKIGLDIEKLKVDMVSDVVSNEIKDTQKLARDMGINGTPHFIVGDKVIPGAPEDLAQIIAGMVKDIRKNGCTVC